MKYLHKKTNTLWKIKERGIGWCDCTEAPWVRITNGEESKRVYAPTFEREYAQVRRELCTS